MALDAFKTKYPRWHTYTPKKETFSAVKEEEKLIVKEEKQDYQNEYDLTPTQPQ